MPRRTVLKQKCRIEHLIEVEGLDGQGCCIAEPSGMLGAAHGMLLSDTALSGGNAFDVGGRTSGRPHQFLFSQARIF